MMLRFALGDFNPYHEPAGSATGGRFTSGEGGGGGDKDKDKPEPKQIAKRQHKVSELTESTEALGPRYSKSAQLKNGTIFTSNVFDATRALYEGRKVNLTQANKTSTLIDHLGKVAARMIDLGEKAPNFDLCKVAVSGSNLFCAESKGIPRAKMPQLDDEQTSKFIDRLKDKYGIERTTEYAANLRATQNELNGAKVARNAERIKSGKDKGNPIIVSKDNYILDGHHRWAARAGLDAGKGRLMQSKMPIARANIGIIDLLDEAERFTGGKGKKGVSDSLRAFLADIYKSQKDLPSATSKLSAHAKLVWRKAFNAAFKTYKGDESKAFATAWAAANKVADAVMAADVWSPEAQRAGAEASALARAGRGFFKKKYLEELKRRAKGGGGKHHSGGLKTAEMLISPSPGYGDAYDPDQPRHRRGHWTSGPGRNAGKGNAPRKPFEVSREQLRKEPLPLNALPEDNYDQQ